MTIPVSMPKMLGAKLFWVGIFAVLLGIYSVGVTLITGLTVGLSGLTVEVFFHGGTQIVLAETGIVMMFFSVSWVDSLSISQLPIITSEIGKNICPAGNIQRWRYLDYWIDGWIIGTDSGSVFSWRYTDRVGSSDDLFGLYAADLDFWADPRLWLFRHIHSCQSPLKSAQQKTDRCWQGYRL